MKFTYNDGGRAAAGFKGQTGDCVCRSIAIASELPYQHIYDWLNGTATDWNKRRAKRGRRLSSARTGVHKEVYGRVLEALGFKWTPTMHIGSGCTVHLRADELPSGRLVVNVSKHLVAVIDGVVHDTFDDQRNGTRCVYGYWRRA